MMSVLRPFICKAMTEDVFTSLRQAKIVTVTDFLSKDKEDIARTCGIDYKDVVSIGRVLLAQYSAFPVSAAQLYSAVMSSQAIFSTGFTSLDELLEGGFYSGELCELTGEAASGKTQVCLRCAVTVAGTHAQNVVFIDTCGSFSTQAVSCFLPQSEGCEDLQGSQLLEDTLSRICCVQASDVYSLLSVLDDLRSALKTQSQSQYSGARLVVVDCVAALFAPIQGGQQIDSLALLEQLGLQLKSLAVECSLAVVVTNNVTRAVSGDPQPSLGRVWTHTPHTRVLLERYPSGSALASAAAAASPFRKATLVKSVRTATSLTAHIDLASS
ncbi:DNA repair protein RAD51 homolog 4-like [Babylonia areolata]|uniref:DNA repair protein RAD51 homolog 4-like n=1 Tax=Babylonia areolata TaxID=304850 RepID=UPI003FD49AA7